MMIEMLRQPLSEQGFDLEQIYLSDYEIEYCTGCAFCLEKGRCWIDDDHKGIMERILAADGVIMASPVYFSNVTAQMKTFLDRSLAFGHKPRSTWKPGLAVSVSAGMGETETARYLASLLRVYGAFSIGVLIGIGPGQFVGKEAAEARAHDLAWDLGRAIKENKRFPATDQASCRAWSKATRHRYARRPQTLARARFVWRFRSLYPTDHCRDALQ
jgi:multimeric flavodoxin WrbA